VGTLINDDVHWIALHTRVGLPSTVRMVKAGHLKTAWGSGNRVRWPATVRRVSIGGGGKIAVSSSVKCTAINRIAFRIRCNASTFVTLNNIVGVLI
jgi:hypothetical protein